MKKQYKIIDIRSLGFFFFVLLAPSIVFGQDAVFTINQKTLSRKCIKANNIQNSGEIIMHNCVYSDSEKWYFEDNSIKLYSNSDYCMELKQGVVSEGTKVHLYTCAGTTSQKWMYEGLTNTIRYVDNPDYCLTFYTESQYASYSIIQLNSCKTVNANQEWKFKGDTPVDLISTGIRNTINLASDTTLRVYPGEGRTNNGSQVTIQTIDVGMDQDLIFNADRSVSIAKRPDRCLDQLTGSTDDGTKIQVFPCTGYNNQKWYYDSFSQLFRAYNNPNKCMRAGTTNGTDVDLWPCSNTKQQQFIVK